MKHKYFSIVTKNVWKLSEFYESVLQAEANIVDKENYVELPIDDFIVCLESNASFEKRTGAPYTAGSLLIEFEVDKVDDEYLRLKQLGVEIIGTPFDNPWGTRNFYFKDPEGYFICFYSEIKIQ
jgi:predicted enzyme related to lactoylglutathione lyase